MDGTKLRRAVNSAGQLFEDGVVVLRHVFDSSWLNAFRNAATRCFAAVVSDPASAGEYRFNRFSNSIPMASLQRFVCNDVMQPLRTPELHAVFSDATGGAWTCDLEQCWVRKKFAPMHAPASMCSNQGWHQDGALGVQFPPEAGLELPLTQLVTCWIPLDACGNDAPGLEFVRGPQPGLLHFTELDDVTLRQRFAPEDFWAPELELSDALVFLNSVLHRTYTSPEMRRNRLSIEYRIFPCFPLC